MFLAWLFASAGLGHGTSGHCPCSWRAIVHLAAVQRGSEQYEGHTLAGPPSEASWGQAQLEYTTIQYVLAGSHGFYVATCC
jgi:hypothetical protein